MPKNTFADVIELNKTFYKKVGASFSETRQYPWKGWNHLLRYIAKYQHPISILDLGCGNGRFYKFLIEHVSEADINYLGIDANTTLLRQAKKVGGKYKKLDVLKNPNNLKDHYNLVVAFGLTHHIPIRKGWESWFEKIAQCVAPTGYLILTFWNFSEQPGDFILGWKNQQKVCRYCHKYSLKEFELIKEVLAKRELRLINTFNCDGKTGQENFYMVFKKN